MHLAEHQRKLLGLFRSTYQVRSDDDAYIRTVARSKDLQEGRRNIFLWRVYVLERTCALTFALLKRRNLLEETVEAFITRHNISPFRETQSPAFLEGLTGHTDRLVACVAQFELALLKIRQGNRCSYLIPWHVEPHAVLNCLARDLALYDEVPGGDYRILVSRDIPGYFRILCVRGREGSARRIAAATACKCLTFPVFAR